MTLTLDRTPLDESEILLTGLPIPPSLNNSYVNASNGGRFKSNRLTKWARACGWQIKEQRQRSVKGPVDITYTFEDGGSKADLGNLEKAATDLLVELRLIEGDDPKIVRSIRLQWGQVDGMRIEVRRCAA